MCIVQNSSDLYGIQLNKFTDITDFEKKKSRNNREKKNVNKKKEKKIFLFSAVWQS